MKIRRYIIEVSNPEQSEQVQKELFKYGFHWGLDTTRVHATDRKYIFLNYGYPRYMGISITDSIGESDPVVVTILSAAYALEHAKELDGAITPKPTELTQEEVTALLGYPVKIVPSKKRWWQL